MRSLILLLSLVNLSGFAQHDSSYFNLYARFPSDSVRNDLQVLKTLLTEVHPGINQHTSPEKISKVIDSVSLKLSGEVTGIQWRNAVSYILAQMHDSHTFIPHTEWFDDMKARKKKVLPLLLTRLGDKYYIAKTVLPQHGSMVGLEIETINNTPVDKIAKTVFKYSSTEGTNTSSFEPRLRDLPFGYYMLFDSTNSFTVSTKDIRGDKAEKKIPGVHVTEADSVLYPYLPPLVFDTKGDSIAVLTINSFSNELIIAAKEDYKKYFQSFFKMLAKKKITQLVIDVRNNAGGKEEVVNELFSWLYPGEYYYFESKCLRFNETGEWKKYLSTGFNPAFDSTKTKDEQGFYCYTEKDDKENANWLMKTTGKKNAYTGRTIVLMNGASYSATGHFISLVKHYKVAKLAGTCSLGSYYSNDGAQIFRLPFSGLGVRIPTTKFTMRLPGFEYDAKGICPDIMLGSQQKDLRVEYDRPMEEAMKAVSAMPKPVEKK